jgi:hypothetical protein
MYVVLMGGHNKTKRNDNRNQKSSVKTGTTQSTPAMKVRAAGRCRPASALQPFTVDLC